MFTRKRKGATITNREILKFEIGVNNFQGFATEANSDI